MAGSGGHLPRARSPRVGADFSPSAFHGGARTHRGSGAATGGGVAATRRPDPRRGRCQIRQGQGRLLRQVSRRLVPGRCTAGARQGDARGTQHGHAGARYRTESAAQATGERRAGADAPRGAEAGRGRARPRRARGSDAGGNGAGGGTGQQARRGQGSCRPRTRSAPAERYPEGSRTGGSGCRGARAGGSHRATAGEDRAEEGGTGTQEGRRGGAGRRCLARSACLTPRAGWGITADV